jgi:hypothetical protein
LSGRNTIRQSLKPNDPFCVLGQELESGNRRQKVDRVEAGNGRVQSREIAMLRMQNTYILRDTPSNCTQPSYQSTCASPPN